MKYKNTLCFIGILSTLIAGFTACRESTEKSTSATGSKGALLASTSATVLKGSLFFKKVFIIVLENTNANDALKRPFLGSLAKEGAYLNKFYANTHPSQPNYIAMTSADRNGVENNNNHTIDVPHIADLLERNGKDWKEYVEDYPGNCFLDAKYKKYARKHAPFISYLNVQSDPTRCAKIVNSEELDKDINNEALPTYSYYVPNLDNDGHDTGIDFADQWLAKEFGPRFKNPKFMKDMLVVVTFDESADAENRIYTVLLGSGVIPGHVSNTRYDFYSLLRTIEDQFGLGTLGKNDAQASPITQVWK